MEAIARFAPRGSSTRRILVWVGVTLAALVYTQLILEGTQGAGRGTPTSILFQGLVLGVLGALTATGLVLVYRVNRIVNFAQAAIGAAGSVWAVFMTRYNPRFPFVITVLTALVLSAAIGALIELVFGRRFAKSPRLVLTVISIVAATFVSTFAYVVIVNAPFFPKQATRGFDDLSPDALQRRLPFAGFDFEVGGASRQFHFADLFAIEVGILLLVLLAIFLRYTRAGVAIRAVAENPERAALLGIGVGGLSTLVWAIAGLLSGATLTLGSYAGNIGGAIAFNPAVFLAPLAAAVLARMRSVPVAVYAAVLISVVSSATAFSVRQAQPLIDAGLFAVVAIGLLVQRRDLFRFEQGGESSWTAAEEPRPIPKEMRGIPGLRIARVALVAVGLLAVGLYPFLVATRLVNLGAFIALDAIAILSLVVLTGWAGQVSLGQYAFFAVGAVASGLLADKVGLPLWFAVPLATVAAGIVAGLIGIPALRIKGLFLAIVTFAFAVAVGSFLNAPRYSGDLLARNVDRPTLFFLDFEEDRSMYFLCIAALIIAIVVVVNLRRSRFGRLLIAMRENESNLQSFGISLVRTKILAFVLSGGLAGFAGAIYAFQQRGVNGASFSPGRSFALFTFAIIGGVSSVGGALLGALWGEVTEYFLQNNIIWQSLQGTAPLVLLYIEPAGLIGVVNQVRDSVLRIVAQRRQLVVPSLFADYDAEALSRQLIPLGEASAASGLAAIPGSPRYSRDSELYRSRNGAPADGGQPKETVEAAALAAAGTREAAPEPTEPTTPMGTS